MNHSLPFFSGLSLIIHVLIIVVSSVYNWFRGNGPRPEYVPVIAGPARRDFKQVVSIAILIGMSTFMLLFTAVALDTGMRVGANEPQRQYMAKLAAQAWSEIDKNVLQDNIQYTRPYTPGNTATHNTSTPAVKQAQPVQQEEQKQKQQTVPKKTDTALVISI